MSGVFASILALLFAARLFWWYACRVMDRREDEHRAWRQRKIFRCQRRFKCPPPPGKK